MRNRDLPLSRPAVFWFRLGTIASVMLMSINNLAANEPRPCLTVLIGGINSDPTAKQMEGTAARREGNSGMYQLRGDFLNKGIEADYFNWNGSTAGNISQKKAPHAESIAAHVRNWRAKNPSGPVAFVGNSWGGHTALDVCQKLLDAPAIEIEIVVFLDPSSAGRPERIKELPINVRQAVNYFTGNAFGWNAWRGVERIENVDLGDPKNGFIVNGQPNYAAAFDLHAHVGKYSPKVWAQRFEAQAGFGLFFAIQRG